MVNTVAFPLANYPNGTRTSAGVNVADNATSITFSVDRCTSATPTIWPNASTGLTLLVEQSNDGGSSWFMVFQFTGVGGIIVDKHGVELPQSLSTTSLNEGTGRQLRANATITGGPLRTAGSFDVD